MTERTCLSIILAAGEGTRMKSNRPKVLHKIAGLPLVGHVAKAASAAGGGAVAVVVGHGAAEVEKAMGKLLPEAEILVQEQRLGTAHAVLSAKAAIERGFDDILVMFGDTPLVSPETLVRARQKIAEGNAVVVMGFRTSAPTGYGRLIEEGGALVAIREEREASEAEKRIEFCNGGLMALAGDRALELIEKIGNANAKGEYYLTDIVEVARSAGLKVVAVETEFDSVLGVNTLAELAEAETIWQQRRRRKMMLSGVTLVAPKTVFFAHDTQVEPDVFIEPNVFFGPDVSVRSGAIIHAFCHIEGAAIGAGSHVGPFARLRPGTDLGEDAKVGNFCETKKAVIEKGAKVNHLSYIGDARVGAGANIGAGTITCNYDGYSKFVTDIGAGAFIGSNSALVAPISIGDGAYVASGSVITEDVPADALAFGRARQKTLPEKAKVLRERRASAKK